MKWHMRKRNRYRNYLSLNVGVILAVLGCFRIFSERKTAAFIAGIFFLISSSFVVLWESRHKGFIKRPSFWAAGFFLIVSVLPIFILRLANWELPFEEISLWGFRGPQLHSFSNKVFIVMMICFFLDSFRENRRELSVAGFSDAKSESTRSDQ